MLACRRQAGETPRSGVSAPEADRLGRLAATGTLPLQRRIQPPQPRRSGATLQRYTVLGRDKIYAAEPPSRPWFGYPYAVVPNTTRFSGQRLQGGHGPSEFLDPNDANTVNVRRAAHATVCLRLSDDANMAIENSDLDPRQPKLFFATDAVISAANTALGAGSIVRLDKQGGSIKILTGWTSQTTLHRVAPVFRTAPPQNCDEIAGRITGVGAGHFMQTRAGISMTNALGRFLEEDPDELNPNADATVRSYLAWQRERPNRLKTVGANAGAKPNVGEAFVIGTLGPVIARQGGAAQVRDIASGQVRTLNWAFHFGAVVARSGRDRITHENYARGDNRVAGADPRWYFQMYGEWAGQSFHEFHEAKEEYANPVTVTATGRAIPRPGPS